MIKNKNNFLKIQKAKENKNLINFANSKSHPLIIEKNKNLFKKYDNYFLKKYKFKDFFYDIILIIGWILWIVGISLNFDASVKFSRNNLSHLNYVFHNLPFLIILGIILNLIGLIFIYFSLSKTKIQNKKIYEKQYWIWFKIISFVAFLFGIIFIGVGIHEIIYPHRSIWEIQLGGLLFLFFLVFQIIIVKRN